MPRFLARAGRVLATGCFLAAVLVVGAPAQVPTAAAPAAVEDLMRARMAWIAARSRYAVPAALPVVDYLSPAMMMIEVYGEDAVAQAEMPGSAVYLPPVVALYNIETRTMYLQEGFDFADPATGSTLVHELVHHMQAAGGYPFACPAAMETEAYRLHNLWIDEKRTGEKHSDPLATLLAGMCRHDR